MRRRAAGLAVLGAWLTLAVGASPAGAGAPAGTVMIGLDGLEVPVEAISRVPDRGSVSLAVRVAITTLEPYLRRDGSDSAGGAGDRVGRTDLTGGAASATIGAAADAAVTPVDPVRGGSGSTDRTSDSGRPDDVFPAAVLELVDPLRIWTMEGEHDVYGRLECSVAGLLGASGAGSSILLAECWSTRVADVRSPSLIEDWVGDADGLPPGPSQVLFDTNGYEIPAGAIGELERLLARLRERPDREAVVGGFAQPEENDPPGLAWRRAAAVRQYLIDRGVPGDRVHALSYGGEAPLDVDRGDEAWARNRSARFYVLSSTVR